jgi:hypothetical protein
MILNPFTLSQRHFVQEKLFFQPQLGYSIRLAVDPAPNDRVAIYLLWPSKQHDYQKKCTPFSPLKESE